MRFVIVTFAFLAFAFYELSGGADFEPRKARPVAEAPQAAEPAVRLVAGEDVVIPDQAKLAAVIEAPAQTLPVARVSPAVVAEKPAPTLALGFGQAAPTSDTADLQLASLASGGQAFLQPATAEAEVAPEVAPVAENIPPADLRQVTGSRVNMRQGPGTTYPVIGTLFYDDQVEVVQSLGNGWVQLRRVSDNRIGWMAERFVGKVVD